MTSHTKVTFFDMAAGRQAAGSRSPKPTLPDMEAGDPCAPLRPSSGGGGGADGGADGGEDDRRDETTCVPAHSPPLLSL